jgi:hypothetical protein
MCRPYHDSAVQRASRSWEEDVEVVVDLEEWLRVDDAKSRPFRAQRAREMMAACPIDEAGVATHGGEDSMTAFFEARLAYVNGLYLCTVLSALAVLERHFTARLYAAGLESAKRMSFDNVVKRALEDGTLTEQQAADFSELRLLRNAYAHFREPFHSAERALREGVPMGDLLKKDALKALGILGREFGHGPRF